MSDDLDLPRDNVILMETQVFEPIPSFGNDTVIPIDPFGLLVVEHARPSRLACRSFSKGKAREESFPPGTLFLSAFLIVVVGRSLKTTFTYEFGLPWLS